MDKNGIVWDRLIVTHKKTGKPLIATEISETEVECYSPMPTDQDPVVYKKEEFNVPIASTSKEQVRKISEFDPKQELTVLRIIFQVGSIESDDDGEHSYFKPYQRDIVELGLPKNEKEIPKTLSLINNKQPSMLYTLLSKGLKRLCREIKVNRKYGQPHKILIREDES
jgi:hypothetical protein